LHQSFKITNLAVSAPDASLLLGRVERFPCCPDHIWPEEIRNTFCLSVKSVVK
jgi:hypothetical protein